MSDLERALEDLEASLASVWEQADAEYVARHYPWHRSGEECGLYADHVHGRKTGRIFYWPETLTVYPPEQP